MRLSTATTLALAASPALVSAASKGKMGFALGTKEPNGDCKTQADYEKDFDAIKEASGATLVRGYAAADCNMTKAILPAAKKKGFEVVLGIWYADPQHIHTERERRDGELDRSLMEFCQARCRGKLQQ